MRKRKETIYYLTFYSYNICTAYDGHFLVRAQEYAGCETRARNMDDPARRRQRIIWILTGSLNWIAY